jgi:hypothetical protein
MVALGVLQPDTVDIDRLEEKLRREAVNTRRPFIVGPRGAAFVRTPVRT